MTFGLGGVALRQRHLPPLPRVAIPLAENDKDVTLDLQAAFVRCWDEGPYPDLLRYDGTPPGTMTPDDVRWCEERLREAG